MDDLTPRADSAQLVSPERRWRCWATLALAGLGAMLTVLIGLATDWHPLLATLAVPVVGLLLLAWRISTTRLTVDGNGLTDHRLLRTVRLGWDDVTGFEVGRPTGMWDGYCVQAVSPSGKHLDLLATRAYSLVPDGHHYDEIHRMAWTLEGLRPQADAA